MSYRKQQKTVRRKMHRCLTWRNVLVNLVRNKSGSGTCVWCGGAWNWKRRHDIYNKGGSTGIFFCCDECWEIMTPEQKISVLTLLYSNRRFCGIGRLERWMNAIRSEDEL